MSTHGNGGVPADPSIEFLFNVDAAPVSVEYFPLTFPGATPNDTFTVTIKDIEGVSMPTFIIGAPVCIVANEIHVPVMGNALSAPLSMSIVVTRHRFKE